MWKPLSVTSRRSSSGLVEIADPAKHGSLTGNLAVAFDVVPQPMRTTRDQVIVGHVDLSIRERAMAQIHRAIDTTPRRMVDRRESGGLRLQLTWPRCCEPGDLAIAGADSYADYREPTAAVGPCAKAALTGPIALNRLYQKRRRGWCGTSR